MSAAQLLKRLGLVLAIGGIAILCLSSALLAAIVGVATAAVVAVDMLAFSRTPPPARPGSEPPETLSVDLSRRR